MGEGDTEEQVPLYLASLIIGIALGWRPHKHAILVKRGTSPKFDTFWFKGSAFERGTSSKASWSSSSTTTAATPPPPGPAT